MAMGLKLIQMEVSTTASFIMETDMVKVPTNGSKEIFTKVDSQTTLDMERAR